MSNPVDEFINVSFVYVFAHFDYAVLLVFVLEKYLITCFLRLMNYAELNSPTTHYVFASMDAPLADLLLLQRGGKQAIVFGDKDMRQTYSK